MKKQMHQTAGPDSAGADLVAQLDAIMDEYLTDPLVIFGSRAERMGFAHRRFARNRRALSSPGLCRFPACEKRSVRRSHAIPKAALDLIAEDGHVLTPARTPEGYCLKRIGLNRASTFPGFCAEHESAFGAFERMGEFSNDSEYAWQGLRSVLLEVVSNEREVRGAIETLREVEDARKRWAQARLTRGRDCYGALGAVLTLEIDADDVWKQAKEKLVQEQAGLQHLVDAFVVPFAAACAGGPLKLTVFAHRIRARLPIALVGRGKITVHHAGKKRAVSMTPILTIIPSRRGTEFIIVAEDHRRDELIAYVNHFRRHGYEEGFMRLAGAWMLHGRRRWYIAPNSWNALLPEQQMRALGDISSEETDVTRDDAGWFLDALQKHG